MNTKMYREGTRVQNLQENKPNLDELKTLEAEIILDIFRAANLLGRIGGKLVVETDLKSVQQWLLLGGIEKEEGISLTELCKNTLVTKQNITGMIERLYQSNLVEKYVDELDRRVTRVKITEKGKEVLDRLKPLRSISNEKTFENFSSIELIIFASLLQKLVSTLYEQGYA